MIFLVALLGILIGADLALTLVGLRIGLREANPIVKRIGLGATAALLWLLYALFIYLLNNPVIFAAVAGLTLLRGVVVRHNWKAIIAKLEDKP